MTGRTNYTSIDNSSAMQGPAQITDVYLHFDALIGETVATVAALPASGNWPGRTILTVDKRWVYVNPAGDATWVVVAGAPLVGVFGSDGNATVSNTTLMLDPFGWVDLVAQSTRTGGSTYATSLILGVVPAGFRPMQDTAIVVLTYGSGSLNQAIVAAGTGLVTLMVASPAGHTAARFTGRWRVA